jgi:hypothetical protein
MRFVRALRRLLANTDRVNDLIAATERMREGIDRLYQAIENQATAGNERLDRLYQAVDNQAASANERLDRLYQATDNQATAVNERLDRLYQAVDNQAASANERLDRLYQATDNQATAVNERLDRLYQTADNQSSCINERLDRLYEASDNLSGNLNRRLDQLIETERNQSAGANERLEAIITAITNQATAANLRLDRIVTAIHGDDLTERRPRAEDTAPVRVAAGPKGMALSTRTELHAVAIKEPAERTGRNAAWLNASSPAPLPLPRWSTSAQLKGGAKVARIRATTNALKQYQPLLEALEPWQGVVPKGYLVDFLGILTDGHFRTMYGVDPAAAGGAYTGTEIPAMHGANGEWWFETINWLAAAREARDRYVMITLGASYGAQAVGAYRALQIVNPLPCKLVAVEPVPENCLWVGKHFRDNGIDPDAHWLINAAISDRNDPIFFPVGGAGSGANNCMSTDMPAERKLLVEQLIQDGKAPDTLRSLMLNNTTGIIKDMLPGQGVTGEIELVSAVTLRDVLSAFDMVDYLEADIQQSEVRVFPPFLDLLKRKVRRIHVGTHGAENHGMLHDLFAKNGWHILFSYAPDGTYKSEVGSFELNDGVLTVCNPDL